MDTTLETYKSKLQHDFPDITISSLIQIGAGWHHVALEINGTIIFRLPQKTHVTDLSATLQYETAVLRMLKNKLPVAIPQPKYIAPDGSYFGYPKLHGEIVEQILGSFKASEQEQFLIDWVGAASAIHTGISVDEAKKLHIPTFDGFDTSRAEKIISMSGVEADIREYAQDVIRRVKAIDKNQQQYVFIHNDLQPQNLLADPASKRLSGVIDWTDVCIAPIAREFAIGTFMYDNRLEKAIDLYKQKTGTTVDQNQAKLWYAIEELGDYVEETDGHETDAAAATLTRIKHLIKRR